MSVGIGNYLDSSPNTIKVTIGALDIYFSYSTPVAYRTPEDGLVVAQNCWSRTTGRHLTAIDRGAREKRIDCEEFSRKLEDVLRKHGLES